MAMTGVYDLWKLQASNMYIKFMQSVTLLQCHVSTKLTVTSFYVVIYYTCGLLCTKLLCKVKYCRPILDYEHWALSDTGFLAVSPQVTLVINQTVGCHCLARGEQLNYGL